MEGVSDLEHVCPPKDPAARERWRQQVMTEAGYQVADTDEVMRIAAEQAIIWREALEELAKR